VGSGDLSAPQRKKGWGGKGSGTYGTRERRVDCLEKGFPQKIRCCFQGGGKGTCRGAKIRRGRTVATGGKPKGQGRVQHRVKTVGGGSYKGPWELSSPRVGEKRRKASAMISLTREK